MLAGSKQNVSVHPGFGWGWREETEGLQPTNQPKTHHSEWSVADGCGTLSYSSLQLQQPRGFRWKCSSGVRSVSHVDTLCCGSCKREECKQIQESARQGRERKFRQIDSPPACPPASRKQQPSGMEPEQWSIYTSPVLCPLPISMCSGLLEGVCCWRTWKLWHASLCYTFKHRKRLSC